MTTPPGWYPDPGHTGNGPALERWWDGNQWSEYTRGADQAQTAAALGAGPPGSAPGYAPFPGGDLISGAGAPGRRGKLAVGIAAAVVVVAGVAGGVIALTGGGSSADAGATTPSRAPSPPPFGNGGQDGGSAGPGGPRGGLPGGPSSAPNATADPGYVLDTVDGIQLPIPDGWKGANDQYGLASLTVGTYACPGDSTKSCVRGGVFSMPTEAAELKSTTAQAAAREDIAKNAEDSYGDDVYGGITSHQQLKAEKVTVADEQGYLVRWKVITKQGDDGYVQSLVFPAPGDSSRLVLIRSGFDVNGKAPKLSVMDQITNGIKSGSPSGTGV
jgi:hypothetical protein